MTRIVSTPDTLGGKPRVKGTRVSAEQIYEMQTLRGMDTGEITEELPTVDREDVEAAIRYMKEHREGEALKA